MKPEASRDNFAIVLIQIPDLVRVFKGETTDASLSRLKEFVGTAIRFVDEHGGIPVNIFPESVLSAWRVIDPDCDRRICRVAGELQRLIEGSFGFGAAARRVGVKAYMSRGECIVISENGRIRTLLGGAVQAALRGVRASAQIDQGLVVDSTIRACCPSLSCESLIDGYFLVKSAGEPPDEDMGADKGT